MKSLFRPAAFVALMCGVALAQSATPPATNQTTAPSQTHPSARQSSPQNNQAPAASSNTPSSSARPTRVAPGSVIPVQLTKTVDAKKAKTGDPVVAKVTMDMKTQSGDVLVPKDTKVIGHVTQAQARNKEQKESELGIAFDRAVTKDGNNMQMPMSIQAVIGQQNSNNNNQQNESAGPSGAPSGGGSPAGGSAGAGRPGGMNGSASNAPPQSSAPAGGENEPQNSGGSMPRINANTQGVIGISNLTLSPSSNGTQGSVMTSEKNNVKLESGTMLLLKVNQ